MSTRFNPEVNTLYLDMDGVLADFDKFVLEKMGRTFDHNCGSDDDELMWESLSKVERMYFHLEPTSYAFEVFLASQSVAKNVEILTAIPRRRPLPGAEQDKRDWIAKHFNPDIKVNMGPFSADKWKHCKPGDILVDDRAANIEDWTTKGFGIGILHEYGNHLPTIDAMKAVL